MTWVAAGVGVAGLATSVIGGMSAKKNAKRQEAAVKAALAERERKVNALYDRMGMADKASIERSTESAIGAAGRSAADRGLGNTSVYDTLQGQARADGLQAQLQSRDNIMRGRAGALADIPIAIPDKPEGVNIGQTISGGLAALGPLLNKIPGVNPNETQNVLRNLGPGGNGPPVGQMAPMNPYGVTPPPQPAAMAQPPAPSQIAGAPSWTNVIGSGTRAAMPGGGMYSSLAPKPRRGVNPYSMPSPYAARAGR